MPGFAGSYVSVATCASAALQNMFPGFALQNGGECYGSASMLSTYAQLGPSSACRNGYHLRCAVLRKASILFFAYVYGLDMLNFVRPGLGNAWANDVYIYGNILEA